jgi:thiosulfate dehydrogenase [quinone] large subunit
MPKVKSMTNHPVRSLYTIAVMRISMGFVFLWAFFDKLLGLGFATCRDAKTDAVSTLCEKAWVNGGSPTTGFLKFAAKGPFADFYHNLAGNGFIDWLFMLGLLLIGVALVFGVATKLATITGSVLLFMMWTAELWPANNPVLDEHIIYIFALMVVLFTDTYQKWGLGAWWRKQSIVKNFPILS